MKKFTKRIENFTCEHCGHQVSGNGYTNHCPNCLYSKHVDNNPGDRQSNCGGLMEPISAAPTKDGFIIVHKCMVCGKTIKQHSSENDDIDTIIKISSNPDFIFGK